MKNIINFAENRNVYMPNAKIKINLLKSIKNIFNYPDYKNSAVNECISKYFNINIDNLMVTNGSLEGINLLINVLDKKKAYLFEPTFWGYEDALKRFNYKIEKEILDEELNYNYDKINLASQKTKLLFLCNPNNPTLSYIPKNILLNIIKNNSYCHFIIDETMLIFDEKYEEKTVSKYVESFENLSVVMSFSKIFGIAGLRTGVLFSNKQVIEATKKCQIPYSLGIIQESLIPNILNNKDYLNKTKKKIYENKQTMCDYLRQIECKVIESNTNFILIQLPKSIDANKLTGYLLEKGLEVRNIKEAYPILSGDWIRISIHKPKYNKILVKTITNYINNERR